MFPFSQHETNTEHKQIGVKNLQFALPVNSSTIHVFYFQGKHTQDMFVASFISPQTWLCKGYVIHRHPEESPGE